MNLPLDIEFQPPTTADLRSLAKPLAVVVAVATVLGIGAIAVLAKFSPPAPAAAAATGMLQVTSVPSGAIIEIDGRELGRTPIDLSVAAGTHRVRLHSPGYASATYDIVVSHGEPPSPLSSGYRCPELSTFGLHCQGPRSSTLASSQVGRLPFWSRFHRAPSDSSGLCNGMSYPSGLGPHERTAR
jgi:hypothetical protein